MRNTLYVVLFLPLFSISASTQTVDFAVRVIDLGLADVSIKIMEYGLADESWKVVGGCSNRPNLTVKIMEYGLADKTIKIVEYGLADRTICITNADQLDEETRTKLGLR